MIALDTNVLVRFLVRDDAAQAKRARAVLETALRRGESIFIADIVLCETVWVLDRAYDFSRAEIVGALQKLVGARHLVFRDPEAISQAIEAYRRQKGDFADYLIREQALAAGCSTVLTFDRALLRDRHFTAP